MAIRFSEFMNRPQFHPEADAIGMSMYLQPERKKKTVIESHGYDKWESMIKHLNDPDKILWTYSHILPNFLNEAVEHLQLVDKLVNKPNPFSAYYLTDLSSLPNQKVAVF